MHRHIPHGAMKIEDRQTGAVAYLYERDNDKLFAVAFHGQRSKEDWHYRFRNAEQREARVRQHFANIRAWQDRKTAEREERKAKSAKGQGLQVGHILKSSWGYDQTNVDYYEVTALVGNTMVELRKIRSATVSDGPNMCSTCVPCPGEYIGEPIRRRVAHYAGGPSIRIESYAHAHLWQGKPDYWSAYA